MNTADNGKKIIKLLARIAISAILLIWIFGKIDLQRFWQDLKTARWGYLALLWVLTIILFYLRSVRMQVILRQLGCNVTNARIFAASAVTCLYGLVIPGILSTGAKWYILKKSTGKGASVLSGMVYNQVSTIIVLMIFGLGALALSNPFPLMFDDIQNHYLLPAICWILTFIILLGAVLLLSRRVGGTVIKGLGFMLKPLPEGIRKKGIDTLEQIAMFQTAGIKFHLFIAILVVITGIGGGVLSFIVAAKSANITGVPAVTYIWLWAMVFIVGRIPITIANCGTREAILILFLSAYGVEESTALLMSMLIFSTAIIMAIIGAAINLVWLRQGKISSTQSPVSK